MNNTLIINFFLGIDTSKSAYDEALKFFHNIFIKFVQLNPDDEIDLFHEYISKMYEKTFSEQITNKDKNSLIRYIYITIQNFLLDKLKEKDIKTISIYTEDNDNDEANLLEFLVKEDRLVIEIVLEASKILEIFDNDLDEDEKRVLCQYLFKFDSDKKFIKLTRAAFDKRVERLKDKLTSLVKRYKFSFEAMEYYINDIYVSEICSKLSL